MKVILVMVMSVDGKTTRGDESSIYEWTSSEDQQSFFSLIAANDLIIMGVHTYLASQQVIKLSPSKLRVALTSHPEKYSTLAVPSQLEFRDGTPQDILAELSLRGYTKALLVGGAATTTKFLRAKLVNELLLTIEPRIFGSGKGLVDFDDLDIHLQLKNIERLNQNGSILLRYVIK